MALGLLFFLLHIIFRDSMMWRRLAACALSLLNVTVKRCTILNPAILLPTAEDGAPHNSVHMIDKVILPTLTSLLTPSPMSDLERFCLRLSICCPHHRWPFGLICFGDVTSDLVVSPNSGPPLCVS